ncbi:unnamed protein product [Sphagnum compactum]
MDIDGRTSLDGHLWTDVEWKFVDGSRWVEVRKQKSNGSWTDVGRRSAGSWTKVGRTSDENEQRSVTVVVMAGVDARAAATIAGGNVRTIAAMAGDNARTVVARCVATIVGDNALDAGLQIVVLELAAL